MKNLRTYGGPPFDVVVIHGGPGAPGYMAPVARELAGAWGVLEPLQTAASLEGQLQELRDVLEDRADLPVTLIGSSWGAMLGFILAGRHPTLVRKLILVGSGVFQAQYAEGIKATRLSRLSQAEQTEARTLMQALDDAAAGDKNAIFAQLADLFTKTDTYDPVTLDLEVLEVQYALNQSVWRDAEKLRASGDLLVLGKRIQCPVLAIHGDYDPHPAAGVRDPLTHVVEDFRFILLENCGHYPWLERAARDTFYDLLQAELPKEKEDHP